MPQSRIIQEYRDKIEETKKEQQLHNSSSNGNDSVNNTKTVEDGIIVDEDNNDNDNNNPLKQITNITNSNTSSNIGNNNSNNISIGSNNSSKSSPQVLQQTELSDGNEEDIIDDEGCWLQDLYDQNIYDDYSDDISYLDDISGVYPLLFNVLCQLDYRIRKILVYLDKVDIADTNSEEKAEKFVDMIFDEIESVKTEKEIKQLNKIYVPQFNIEHNDGMNLYDLYRMYHADVPLLKAKSIIPYYPEDDSFEKKLLYRVLPEAMKKGVIDSLERIFRSSIFEPFAKVRINKIRETIKQKRELDKLKEALYEYALRDYNTLE